MSEWTPTSLPGTPSDTVASVTDDRKTGDVRRRRR
jgi:hypothetical protein